MSSGRESARRARSGRAAAILAVIALVAPSCGPTAQRQRATSPRANLTRTTVAVADFEGGSIPATEEGSFWKRALALNLLADLRASDALRIVDRSHLAEVLNEQRLSVSDLSDPTSQLRLGRIVGAQIFVFGTYTIVGGTAILTARMTEVETGQVLKSEKVSGRADEMGGLSKQLSISLLRGLDEQLAARQSEKLQSAGGGPPLEALRYFSEGLDLEDRREVEEAIVMYTKALTVWPQYDEARERLEKASEAAVRR